MDRFVGLQYPLIKTPRGVLAQKKNVDQIKADLLQLLLTHPGERVMLPNFGTPLKELQFEPNDPLLAIQARQMIDNAIRTWEPRIVVQNIRVTSNPDSSVLNQDDDLTNREHILFIEIEFVDPENISEIQALVLQVPLSS